jgi:hypothetical protein
VVLHIASTMVANSGRREKEATGAKTPLTDATLNNGMLSDTAASGSARIHSFRHGKPPPLISAVAVGGLSRALLSKEEQLKRCPADRERAAAVPALPGTKYLFGMSSIRPHALTGQPSQPSLAAAKVGRDRVGFAARRQRLFGIQILRRLCTSLSR